MPRVQSLLFAVVKQRLCCFEISEWFKQLQGLFDDPFVAKVGDPRIVVDLGQAVVTGPYGAVFTFVVADCLWPTSGLSVDDVVQFWQVTFVEPCLQRYASFDAFLDNADALETIPVTAAMIEAALAQLPPT